jgi:hypothetical protein
VTQSILKTSQGSVSGKGNNLTLPGGEYGFYPQIKYSGESNLTAFTCDFFSGTSYVTNIWLTTTNGIGYAQQRYISSSGKEHWIYLLRDKTTSQIIAAYEAPDHPSANSQALHIDIPHPFGFYDPMLHDIVLLDNDALLSIKPYLNRNTGILDVINQRGVVDDVTSTTYYAREIRKINEFPDDPYPGRIKSVRMKTPQWAKIMIKPAWVSLETFAVESLPTNIQYRKLYLNP